MENISELKLKLRNAGRTGWSEPFDRDECVPVWQLGGALVRCLVNQYPKEWLANEVERDELLKYDLADLMTVEPWWKLILGNKALLPLLWSMYPHHQYLLPAYYDEPHRSAATDDYREPLDELGKVKWVSKPLFGREGQGVLVSSNFSSYEEFVAYTRENYGRDEYNDTLGKSIYQMYRELPSVQGRVI